jgi:hypothetical protein
VPNRQSSQRWYPSKSQLDSPEKLAAAFKQMLDQHYSLVDRSAAANATAAPSNTSSSGFPPGSGPYDTTLLGLRVAPVDVQTLADGTKLTFVKKSGNFQFL